MFAIVQISGYFNTTLARKRHINVTQVNFAPPTTIPEIEESFYLPFYELLGKKIKNDLCFWTNFENCW